MSVKVLAEAPRTWPSDQSIELARVFWEVAVGGEAFDPLVEVEASTLLDAELACDKVAVEAERVVETTSGEAGKVVGAGGGAGVGEVPDPLVGLAVTRMFVEVVAPVRVTDVAEALVTVPPRVRLFVARVTDGPVSFRLPAIDTESDRRMPLRVVKKFPATSKLFSPSIPLMKRPPAAVLQMCSQDRTKTLSPVKSRVLSRNRSAPFRKRFRMPVEPPAGGADAAPDTWTGVMTGCGVCNADGVGPAVALALT